MGKMPPPPPPRWLVRAERREALVRIILPTLIETVGRGLAAEAAVHLANEVMDRLEDESADDRKVEALERAEESRR